MSFNSNANIQNSDDTSTSNVINLDPVAGNTAQEMTNTSRNFIDVNRLLQSIAFLRSDLGDLVNIPQNLPNFQPANAAAFNSQNQATAVIYPNRTGMMQNRSHGGNTGEPDRQDAEQGMAGGVGQQQPFVLNFGNQSNQQQQAGQGEQAPGEPNQANFFVDALGAMTSSLPFVLIFIAKIFHQHLLGFIIVLGFLVTLHWSNRFLVNQVDLKVR